jgi:hypothetical protein
VPSSELVRRRFLHLTHRDQNLVYPRFNFYFHGKRIRLKLKKKPLVFCGSPGIMVVVSLGVFFFL